VTRVNWWEMVARMRGWSGEAEISDGVVEWLGGRRGGRQAYVAVASEMLLACCTVIRQELFQGECREDPAQTCGRVQDYGY